MIGFPIPAGIVGVPSAFVGKVHTKLAADPVGLRQSTPSTETDTSDNNILEGAKDIV